MEWGLTDIVVAELTDLISTRTGFEVFIRDVHFFHTKWTILLVYRVYKVGGRGATETVNVRSQVLQDLYAC